ncbi:MAG: CAP domain-containing protein [Candidatus Taylorbacteria bacterium]|nr:CAP domain-containing protein [Candidatus Taylorbacteria bacterium]
MRKIVAASLAAVAVLAVFIVRTGFWREAIKGTELERKFAELEKLVSPSGVTEAIRETLPGLESAVKRLEAPGPLRKPNGSAAPLTQGGVWRLTNDERVKAGFPPLALNLRLNVAALSKLQDMFARQYFEHVALTGEDAGHLTGQAGYDFLSVGENLALGNFSGDAGLVAAWMASPGHRANILSPRFSEIGIAVGEGFFESRRVWMAVQIFGWPAESCPAPDENLRRRIEVRELELEVMEDELTRRQETLESEPGRRRQAVEEYNNLVARYNALVKELKLVIEEYNAGVRSFNECVSG